MAKLSGDPLQQALRPHLWRRRLTVALRILSISLIVGLAGIYLAQLCFSLTPLSFPQLSLLSLLVLFVTDQHLYRDAESASLSLIRTLDLRSSLLETAWELRGSTSAAGELLQMQAARKLRVLPLPPLPLREGIISTLLISTLYLLYVSAERLNPQQVQLKEDRSKERDSEPRKDRRETHALHASIHLQKSRETAGSSSDQRPDLPRSQRDGSDSASPESTRERQEKSSSSKSRSKESGRSQERRRTQRLLRASAGTASDADHSANRARPPAEHSLTTAESPPADWSQSTEGALREVGANDQSSLGRPTPLPSLKPTRALSRPARRTRALYWKTYPIEYQPLLRDWRGEQR